MAGILFVSSQGKIGGAERSLLLLLPYVRRRYDVSVACPLKGGLAEEIQLAGGRCYPLPRQEGGASSPWDYGTWLLQAAVGVESILRKTRADLIHANTVHAAMTVLPTSLRSKCKFIWHARDCLTASWPARICGRFAQRVVAVSNAVKHHHAKQGIDPDKIQVIYNGIEKNAVQPRRSYQSDTEPRQLTFANVGQFVPWKRQSLFIAAASRVAAVMPESRFWLVGDKGVGWSPAYGKIVRKCVKDHCLTDCVELVPWQKDLSHIWNGIDCLVHTAIGEPFGRVVIEAMARGIPVIAADSGGPSEILTTGNTGILVPPNDVEALSAAMLRIANHPEMAHDLGSRGCRAVQDRFLAERTAEQILNIYSEVMGDP